MNPFKEVCTALADKVLRDEVECKFLGSNVTSKKKGRIFKKELEILGDNGVRIVLCREDYEDYVDGDVNYTSQIFFTIVVPSMTTVEFTATDTEARELFEVCVTKLGLTSNPYHRDKLAIVAKLYKDIVPRK